MHVHTIPFFETNGTCNVLFSEKRAYEVKEKNR